MDTITYSAARASLATTMDKVCQDHEPLIITRSGQQSVVHKTFTADGFSEFLAGCVVPAQDASPPQSALSVDTHATLLDAMRSTDRR